MLNKAIFAGFGGQGILLMGYALAYTAMLEDKEVTFLPSYGAEMRGGTANCTVAISEEEIASPVASAPEYIVVMNAPSLLRFQNQVKSGGTMLLNSALVKNDPSRDDVTVYRVPASEIAEEMGNIRVANMIMLGAFLKVTNMASLEILSSRVLKEVFPEEKKGLIDINKTALQKGYDFLTSS